MIKRLWSQFFTALTPSSVTQQPILSQQAIQQLAESLGGLASICTPNPKASESQKQGELASRYLGSGLEYEESRLYQPGDEVRRINWRLMARTGQAYTKLFQEERQEAWTLLVDQRQSMRFGTQIRLKVVQALRVAGYFTWQAQQAALPVHAIALAEEMRVSPTYEGGAVFEQILDFLSVPCPPLNNVPEVRLYDALMDCQLRLQSGARLILLSDFADLDEQTIQLLANLQDRVMVKAILIYDAAEKKLPPLKGVRLAGMTQSSGQMSLSLSADQQRSYQNWADAYFDKKRADLQRAGVTLLTVNAAASLTEIRDGLKAASGADSWIK